MKVQEFIEILELENPDADVRVTTEVDQKGNPVLRYVEVLPSGDPQFVVLG